MYSRKYYWPSVNNINLASFKPWSKSYLNLSWNIKCYFKSYLSFCSITNSFQKRNKTFMCGYIIVWLLPLCSFQKHYSSMKLMKLTLVKLSPLQLSTWSKWGNTINIKGSEGYQIFFAYYYIFLLLIHFRSSYETFLFWSSNTGY